MRALFTGSFDPVTNGHLDLIQRMAPLVDSLVVAILVNSEKRPIFTNEERIAMLRDACHAWSNVEITAYQGLVVDAARHFNVTAIVRGIRHSAELEREMQMARMNQALSGIETLLLPASPQWAFVSSSLIKEVARYGGDISPFVPKVVAEQLRARCGPQ